MASRHKSSKRRFVRFPLPSVFTVIPLASRLTCIIRFLSYNCFPVGLVLQCTAKLQQACCSLMEISFMCLNMNHLQTVWGLVLETLWSTTYFWRTMLWFESSLKLSVDKEEEPVYQVLKSLRWCSESVDTGFISPKNMDSEAYMPRKTTNMEPQHLHHPEGLSIVFPWRPTLW